MRWKIFFSFLFFLFVVGLLVIYWFFPFENREFFITTGDSNFSVGTEISQMQFYENMRFSNPEISYKIEDCTLQKKDDMERAFEIVDNLTVLSFHPVNTQEEISVTCSSKNQIEGGLFIAGEGGPVNITDAEKFNVIFNGKILLLKDSKCANPNIGVHELFHVLGFNHSSNSNNIMYPVSKCRQEISDDMVNLINELYSVPSLPDLVFEDVSADVSGKYFDISFTVRNYGLADAEGFKINIYADEKRVKKIDMDEIDVGFGRSITLTNLLIPQFSVKKLELIIESSYSELDKENNKINLEIKNQN